MHFLKILKSNNKSNSKFNNKALKMSRNSKGEVLVSFVLAAIVFIAIAFGIMEMGIFAYKEVVASDKLKTIVRKAESRSELFIDLSASELLNIRDRTWYPCTPVCDDKGVASCVEDYRLVVPGSPITCKEVCDFWKTSYELAKSEGDMRGILNNDVPDVVYDKNGTCKAKVALVLPGFESKSINPDDPSAVKEFKAINTTHTVLRLLQGKGSIIAKTNVIKTKGLFSFYSDGVFKHETFHVGKPRMAIVIDDDVPPLSPSSSSSLSSSSSKSSPSSSSTISPSFSSSKSSSSSSRSSSKSSSSSSSLLSSSSSSSLSSSSLSLSSSSSLSSSKSSLSSSISLLSSSSSLSSLSSSSSSSSLSSSSSSSLSNGSSLSSLSSSPSSSSSKSSLSSSSLSSSSSLNSSSS